MNTTKILENLYYEMNSIYPLIIIPFGTVGNLIVIFIYTRKKLFKTSTGFYFAFSAMIDTLVLYFGSIKYVYYGFRRENMLNISNFMCKFFRYSIYVLVAISAWTLVVINIDRLRISSHMNKKKWQILIIFLMISIISILNIPILIFFEQENSCVLKNGIKHTINIIDSIFSIFIPYTLMIISDVLMVLKIYKSKNKVLDRKNSQKIAYHYMFLAVGRSSIFLVLNSPIYVFLVYTSLKENDVDYYDKIIFTIFNFLFYFDYSMNIFIHLTLNLTFRKRFSLIIRTAYLKICRLKNNKQKSQNEK